MKKIIICGKGGVGKTFIVYEFSKIFAKKGYKVLVVDADESNNSLFKLFGFKDPPFPLINLLGGKKGIQKQMMKMFASKTTEPTMDIIDKESIAVQEIPSEFKRVKGDITLFIVGKIKEPMEGCACPMGALSRDFLEKIQLDHNSVLLVDTEAGIEHFGRGLERGVDTLIAIAEPYMDSIEIAEKALSLAHEMGKTAYLILNKVPIDLEEKVIDIANNRKLNIIGIVHFSQNVYKASVFGQAQADEDISAELHTILNRING